MACRERPSEAFVATSNHSGTCAVSPDATTTEHHTIFPLLFMAPMLPRPWRTVNRRQPSTTRLCERLVANRRPPTAAMSARDLLPAQRVEDDRLVAADDDPHDGTLACLHVDSADRRPGTAAASHGP